MNALFERLTARSTMQFAIEGLCVVAAYAGLAFSLLYPLFAHPSSALIDPFVDGPIGALCIPDINLMIWEFTWGWHALTTDPGNLLNANIFHPAPATFALSDHSLGHLPVFGPVYAFSGNPVLANQMDVFASFVLCGVAMYALLRHWGMVRSAAFFGGFVYAFCPIRAYGTVHAHIIAGQYFPLSLLFLDRTLTDQTRRAAAGFGFFLLLQMLCAYYLAYMTLTALAGYAAGIVCALRGLPPRRGVARALAAGCVAVAALAILSVPYLRLKSLGLIAGYEGKEWLTLAANDLWRNYLYPPIALRLWGWRLEHGISNYVGILALLCAIIAVLARQRGTGEARRWAPAALCGIVITSYVFALGPEWRLDGCSIPLPYQWAMWVVPGFASMRAPTRFGFVLMAGLAALAGLGGDQLLQWLRRHGASRRLVAFVVPLLLAGTAWEYDLLRYRFAVRHVPVGANIPPVYRALARYPFAPVLEIPAGSPPGDLVAVGNESEYMFFSLFHWRPLLNGYSGYAPPSYEPIMALAHALPNRKASELLRRATGLRYVIVHQSKLSFSERARWRSFPGLGILGVFGSDLLFELSDSPVTDLLPALVDFAPRHSTILGTALEPLPEDGRRARVALIDAAPAVAAVDRPLRLELIATNVSDRVWPAFVSVGRHMVALGCRWERLDGTRLGQDLKAGRLPYDLAPGESARAALTAMPTASGPSRLIVGVVQDDVWFATPLTFTVNVR